MTFQRMLCFAGALCFLSFFQVLAARAQGAIEVRTRDGRTFFADSVETRADRLIIRPRGLPPIETPVSNIQCIGQACAGAAGVRPQAPVAAAYGHVAIHGSNTIGASFMPLLIRKYGESLPGGSVDVKFGAVADEQTISLISNGAERGAVELAAHGSGTAFSGLLEGRTTIGMSSRAIKPDEAKALQSRYGVNMLGSDSEHVIALDGLAVIVNRSNPAGAISFSPEQIARIFAGEVTDWSQIAGGPTAPIIVFRRDEKSGTASTFEDLIVKPFKKTITPAAKSFESSEQLSDAVEADVNAIGFIGLPYVRNNQPLPIATGCGIAHAPSRFAIQTEVYPLSRRLYLYTLGTPDDQLARNIVAFAKSDAAQAIVQEAGFIDQSIEMEDAQARARWLQAVRDNSDSRASPKDLARMLQDGESVQRASVNFRFQTGSSDLDNKALADVRRLAAYLRSSAALGKQWSLVGFADSIGDYATNLELSRRRAVAVGEALSREGVTVARANLAAYSWLAPVACNDNDQGRALNRRVEVWLR